MENNYFIRLLPNGRVFIRNIATNDSDNLQDTSKIAEYMAMDSTKKQTEEDDAIQ